MQLSADEKSVVAVTNVPDGKTKTGADKIKKQVGVWQMATGRPELLNASHIIPWSETIPRRADPRNGLALHVTLNPQPSTLTGDRT